MNKSDIHFLKNEKPLNYKGFFLRNSNRTSLSKPRPKVKKNLHNVLPTLYFYVTIKDNI